MKLFFVIYCSFFLVNSLQAKEISTLFRDLDNSIPQRLFYFAVKENKLSDLKDNLSQTQITEQKFELSKVLMTEYSYYVCDSAFHYADLCLQYAYQLENDEYVQEILMDQAYLMCFQGMLPEAFKILKSIDTDKLSNTLVKKYYHTLLHAYLHHIYTIHYMPSKEKYKQEALKCIEKYMELETKNSAQCMNILMYRYYLQEKYKEAVTVANQILEREDITPYMRAETLYNLGGIFLDSGDEFIVDAKKALTRASIIANELVLTKNPPLLNLAILLSNEKKYVNRAYHYINIASEDAMRFSNGHNASLTDQTFNTKQNLNYIKIRRQQIMLQLCVGILVLFCLVITLMMLKLINNNKTLTKIRKELSDANANLRDSNRIKDTYIIHFLNRYSSHLNKVDGYKKNIIRQLNTSQPSEVIKKQAMKEMNTSGELNVLFSEFDKSVLELYPNFIEQVNNLLKEDKKYSTEKQDKLNTELRILALLRLGINDNKQIASFFRFTVQTVYNYRSKAKARAIIEETFEEDIKQICNYS